MCSSNVITVNKHYLFFFHAIIAFAYLLVLLLIIISNNEYNLCAMYRATFLLSSLIFGNHIKRKTTNTRVTGYTNCTHLYCSRRVFINISTY